MIKVISYGCPLLKTLTNDLIHSIEDFNFINDDFKVVSLKDQPYQILVDDKSFYEEYYSLVEDIILKRKLLEVCL